MAVVEPADGGPADRAVGDGRAAGLRAAGGARSTGWPISAAHVVADPLADGDPWLAPAIDWEATIRYREYLWDLGLGVAEAMDTAQRGMGLGWPEAQELIGRALAAAKGRAGGADRLRGGDGPPARRGRRSGVDDVIRAYEEQVEAVEALGGRIILMASRALAAAARGPDDYVRVYDRVLVAGAGAGDHPLARARCSTRRWRATGGRGTTGRRWRPAST